MSTHDPRTEESTATELVHLGRDVYHKDRGGLPGCPQTIYRVPDRPTTIDRKRAESGGWRPCSKCYGGGV